MTVSGSPWLSPMIGRSTALSVPWTTNRRSLSRRTARRKRWSMQDVPAGCRLSVWVGIAPSSTFRSFRQASGQRSCLTGRWAMPMSISMGKRSVIGRMVTTPSTSISRNIWSRARRTRWLYVWKTCRNLPAGIQVPDFTGMFTWSLPKTPIFRFGVPISRLLR